MVDGEFADIAESDQMTPRGRGSTHMVFNVGAAQAKEFAELETDRRIEADDDVDSRNDDDFSWVKHGVTMDDAAKKIAKHNLREEGYKIGEVACSRDKWDGWYDRVGDSELNTGDRDGFRCVAGINP